MVLDKRKCKDIAGGYFLNISVAVFVGGVVGGTFGGEFDLTRVSIGFFWALIIFILALLLKGGK